MRRKAGGAVQVVKCSAGKGKALLRQGHKQLPTKGGACAAACDSHHNQMEADEVVVGRVGEAVEVKD